ncbi:hypothetical protein J5X84_38380 [Streptosporangiaceae bacterium NEAU-GS5]|nr:hypothetical protein [Streptosporangiaceae bacterium NEAU-GS5]
MKEADTDVAEGSHLAQQSNKIQCQPIPQGKAGRITVKDDNDIEPAVQSRPLDGNAKSQPVFGKALGSAVFVELQPAEIAAAARERTQRSSQFSLLGKSRPGMKTNRAGGSLDPGACAMRCARRVDGRERLIGDLQRVLIRRDRAGTSRSSGVVDASRGCGHPWQMARQP